MSKSITIETTDHAHFHTPAPELFVNVAGTARTVRGFDRIWKRVRHDQTAGGSNSWAFNVRFVADDGQVFNRADDARDYIDGTLGVWVPAA